MPKAAAADFMGRFREIVSDPLNLLIRRHPDAGLVSGQYVTLHNGLQVPFKGADAYYETFSDILVINRGVHEPPEEYAFQQLLGHLPAAPSMLELGAYWGHYSMWMKQARPQARVHLVEPDPDNLAVGRKNFAHNGLEGTFQQGFVGRGRFEVDTYIAQTGLDRLTLLHCDIQGFEVEMLEGARKTLSEQRVDYLFVSTHSQSLHDAVLHGVQNTGYRVELSSDFDHQSTCFDGFILAVHPNLAPVMPGPAPLGREQIVTASPDELIKSLTGHLA